MKKVRLTKDVLRGLIKEEIRRTLYETWDNNDFAQWKAKVDRQLQAVWPESGGLDGLGIPDRALKMHFDRGDDAETIALMIKEDNYEE